VPPKPIKIVLDECVQRSIELYLVDRGHIVVPVTERIVAGSHDPLVVAVAQQEQALLM
jgi:hypothetical protein